MGARRAGVRSLLVLAAFIVLVLVAFVGAGFGAGTPLASATPGSGTAIDSASGLPTIQRSALPREALATLDRIAAHGPFPHPEDGAVFQNRERILPREPAGYYHEYTVETPGSADRGGRRIVTGRSDEAYWTADHYASFARIVP